MDYTTVEYLETITRKKRLKHKILHFLGEIKVLSLIFIVVTLGLVVFTNAKLFISDIEGTIQPQAPTQALTTQTISQDHFIASAIDTLDQKNQEIQNMLQEYKKSGIQSTPLAESTQQVLEDKRGNYDFRFNTLPPSNRLIVPSLGVNDPIITSKYMEVRDFTNGNFDNELEQGPVKYPTTPDPGQNGNTLIFGHTSQERWKKNPFSMTFAHIAEIKEGEMIQVVRNGNLHQYKVVAIAVKYPQHVNEEYMKYTNLGKSYITLMGCYPIGTDKQRILVTAEEVKE